jgi:hypothetical protein
MSTLIYVTKGAWGLKSTGPDFQLFSENLAYFPDPFSPLTDVQEASCKLLPFHKLHRGIIFWNILYFA